MKLTAVLCLVCVVMVTAVEETYPTTWDNINLDDILGNNRLVNNYIKCLLDQGKCTPDGAALKKFLPDALKTDCSKCTDKQKEGGIKVFLTLVEKKPKQWEEVVKKFDPEGLYTEAFKSRSNQTKI